MIKLGDSVYIPVEVGQVIERLRGQLHERGVNLLKDMKEGPTNIMVTCTKHQLGQERNPSCGISKEAVTKHGKTYEAGTVHCFTCGYTVDLSTFISNCFGHEGSVYGRDWLKQNYFNFSDSKPKIKLAFEKSRPIPQKLVTEDELVGYRFTHPYIYSRGINDTILNAFDVGYDKQSNAITFPVHDSQGRVVFIQRRSVVGKTFHNSGGVEKSQFLYGLYQLRKVMESKRVDTVIICESIIDVLYLWSLGKPALATFGADISDTQINLLSPLPLRSVVVGYDNDIPGQRAKRKFINKFEGIRVLYQPDFPDGVKDWNDLTPQQVLELPYLLAKR